MTTHYIDDAVDGDYYTDYRDAVALLSKQNHEVGSHSVGHFRDFDQVPFGTFGEDISTYHPGYHDGVTKNASLLGELEVSKNLLEEDTGLPVLSFRSGHLSYPEKLITALDTLDYRFNSSYSANDVLSSFPYITYKERSFSNSQSKVLEIPLTISDVIDEEFTDENYLQVAAFWTNITEKYYANGAPTVLLIHPNRNLKLRAMQTYFENLPPDISIQSIRDFGNFWLQRNDLQFSSSLKNNHLQIQLKDLQTLPDSLSLNISNGASLDEIEILGRDGNQTDLLAQVNDDGTVLLYNQENATKRPSSITPKKTCGIEPKLSQPFFEKNYN